MRLARTLGELREALGPAWDGDARIGLVPTMGAFHEGHRALFGACRGSSDVAVVSLFVNPAQFGPHEDLERYPRDKAGDARLAEEAGVDVLFAPTVGTMYPAGFDTWVDPGALGTVLEGASRPGHFRGVATVCVRLFGLIRPAVAWFGRKDAQQVAVLKQIARDLALPLEIRVAPTVRDPDGLAFSSRNRLLGPEQRSRAQTLPRALAAGLEAHRAGRDAVPAARAVLERAPGLEIDYVAVADLDGRTLAAAVLLDSVRLIDNVLLEEEAAGHE